MSWLLWHMQFLSNHLALLNPCKLTFICLHFWMQPPHLNIQSIFDAQNQVPSYILGLQKIVKV